MTEKNMVKADFYTAVVLMAFGIAITVLALKMPVTAKNPYSAPGLLPGILGVIITGLSFIMFIRSIIRSKGKVGVQGASFKTFFNDIVTRRMIIAIILCISYGLLLGKLFFPLLTFLYNFIFIVFFEYDRNMPFKAQIKKLVIAAIIAICTAVLITAVFQYLFLIRLP